MAALPGATVALEGDEDLLGMLAQSGDRHRRPASAPAAHRQDGLSRCGGARGRRLRGPARRHRRGRPWCRARRSRSAGHLRARSSVSRSPTPSAVGIERRTHRALRARRCRHRARSPRSAGPARTRVPWSCIAPWLDVSWRWPSVAGELDEESGRADEATARTTIGGTIVSMQRAARIQSEPSPRDVVRVARRRPVATSIRSLAVTRASGPACRRRSVRLHCAILRVPAALGTQSDAGPARPACGTGPPSVRRRCAGPHLAGRSATRARSARCPGRADVARAQRGSAPARPCRPSPLEASSSATPSTDLSWSSAAGDAPGIEPSGRCPRARPTVTRRPSRRRCARSTRRPACEVRIVDTVGDIRLPLRARGPAHRQDGATTT